MKSSSSTVTSRPFAWLTDNPYLLLVLATLSWSGNHVLGRAISGHVPPIGISEIRWLVPAIMIWAVAHPRIKRDWPTIRAHWGIMLWLGITGGSLFTILQYIGLHYTTALNVSVINSLVPVLIVAAGTVIFRDRITGMQMAGIATSSLGVLVILAQGRFDTLRALQFNLGDLIMVFNMAVFAIYSAFLRLRPQVHWMSFLFVIAITAATTTLPFAIWEGLSGVTFKPTLLTAGAALYVAIFPSIVSFAAWNRSVEIIGANRSGPFHHLIPVFTALLATFLLNEVLAGFHVIGFALILAGVWLASRKQSAAATRAATP